MKKIIDIEGVGDETFTEEHQMLLVVHELTEYVARCREGVTEANECHIISKHVVKIMAARLGICPGRAMIAKPVPD